MQTINIITNRRGLTAIAFFITISFVLVGPANAGGPQCTSPYVQVQGAASSTFPDPTNQYSIESVSIGEPFLSCFSKGLTVVLKIPTMDPQNTGTAAPPPNAAWAVHFNIPGTANSTGAQQEVFVQYDTETIPTGAFNVGWFDGTFNCTQCTPGLGACAVTGTVAPNGTITMNLNLSSLVTFGTCGTGPTMTVSPAQWAAGVQLNSIQGTTERFIGGGGTGFALADAATAGDGIYTLSGNTSCSNPPTAALSATPTSGNAPLLVNFDASASNNAGGCGTINSYFFDFGDGQQVTQATPTVSHTYTTPATYPARVRVTNTVPLTSAFAQQNITVSGGPPVVSSIVSRMTHGGAGDFDIVLPQPPSTRAVECRNSAGTYKMVFTFLNNLISVASASVTSGTGAVGSGVLGPNSNQYTVNLTGVANAQNLTVTLNSAVDAVGGSGNVTGIMGVLIGDTTNDGSANSADIGQTKSRSGVPMDGTNFRSDVNLDATLNSADIGLVKSKSGTAIP